MMTKMSKIRRKEYNSKIYQINRQIILRTRIICEECAKEGKVSPVQQTDHIISIEEWYRTKTTMEGCSELDNLQGLCYDCHNEKTDRERKSYWSRYRNPRKRRFNKDGEPICLTA